MARKPVILEGAISPRQRIWNVIRAQRADWTADDIINATRRERALGGTVDADTLRSYLRCLIAAKIVAHVGERTEPGAATRKTYSAKLHRLIVDEGVDAPRVRKDGSRVTQGLAQEQMWRTLRLLAGGDTNARELAAHASSSIAPVAEVAAADYLRMLALAGYLDCTVQGHGALGSAPAVQSRFRLRADRNTGPKPPMICRTKVVFDPNLCAVVWAPTVTEEDADHGR